MTKRSQLKHYIHSLTEIGDIMTAMKNLSFIEVNKLTKFLTNQEHVVKTLEDVGTDFFNSYPLLPSFPIESPPVYILIGSERGFCGTFNKNIINQWQNEIKTDARIVVIGRRLILKLADAFQVTKEMEGPSVAEEIPTVISSLSSFLEENSISPSFGNFHIIYNKMIDNHIITKSFSPFTTVREQKGKSSTFAPLLNLSPEEFLSQFLENYLFAVLYDIFYQSLIAENYQRLSHLNGAISKLEKKCLKLTHQMNTLRQEEITEEIEVILTQTMA